MLNEIILSVQSYYGGAKKAEKIIIESATAAVAASALGGIIPGAEVPALIFSSVGAVWSMYIRLSDCLGISLGKNILKVLASAALSNIAANLAGMLVLDFVTSFVPGLGSATGAVTMFISVYLAGMLYMKTVLQLAKKGQRLDGISEETLKAIFAEQKLSKSEIKEAKNLFKTQKA